MTWQQMWAGWRAEYIASASQGGNLPGPGQTGSVFTRILASGIPDDDAYIVHRGDQCFVILNAYPYNSGHVLIMPYRETGELELLTPAEHSELFSLTTQAVQAIKRAYKPEGVNVGMNLGEAAGAGVPGHLHVHVVPRWTADSNFMTTTATTRVIPESLPLTLTKLRAAWVDIEGSPLGLPDV